MLDDHADQSATPQADGPGDTPADAATEKTAVAAKKVTRKRTTKKAAPTVEAATQAPAESATSDDTPEAETKPKKAPARKRTTKKVASATEVATTEAPTGSGDTAPAGREPGQEPGEEPGQETGEAKPAKKTTRKRTSKKATSDAAGTGEDAPAPAEAGGASAEDTARPIVAPLFQAPETTARPARRTAKKAAAGADEAPGDDSGSAESGPADGVDIQSAEIQGPEIQGAEGDSDESGEATGRRKRRRGGRRRRKSGGDSSGTTGESGESEESSEETKDSGPETAESNDAGGGSTSSRRRRRRRRAGDDDGDNGSDDAPANTVTRVRSGRSAADEITAVSGSTRLEAKKQRRREGREAGRRRAPIVSEAEFLARRESVNRVMVIRQHGDVTQIGVLEDNVLVEHYVARESQTSLIGNVYLGRVQNVLPSMEAAFIDIGKGRNAVLYAGEVNWSALGHKEGQPRKIESVLSSGQTILVQVTKDPIGHKGARLTSQISLAGRFLVYVPDGTTSGISRKLPDTERNRLKTLLKEIVPEQAGVIVRTAAEGASEDELTRDVERLKARWEDIEKKAGNKSAGAQLLYGEPDLTLKVVRDLFTEDFAKLVIEGDDAWDTVQGYVAHVAPDLEDRLERYEPKKGQDVFAAYRIDEQIKKGLERKVWLPSGGSLIIDRTEAMTVVDVNTGKFTGSGGNLEETVTKNNLEAAEEIVRQLRLRDIGGIIVVDFIDMVLESNRDLVLRRLVECLGRDRTRHQVAEVTSLGLVQMTRKRIGTGLLESFSHDCPTCHGRGVVIEEEPVEPKKAEEEPRRGRNRRSRGRSEGAESARPSAPSPKDIAAMARHHDDQPDELTGELTGEQADELIDELIDEQADDFTDDLVDELVADAPAAEATVEPTDATKQTASSGEPAAEAAETTGQTPAESPDEPPDAVSEVAEQPGEPEAPAGEPTETVAETAAEPVPEQAPAEPEKPRVVTRTRRRSASRPAGPPSSTATDHASASGDRPDGASGEPGDQPADETPALHVPVKRKGGARKR
jgi:ribonuclease E